MVEKIAQRVVAQISEKVVREIAWEVIPDLAEALIKQEIERLKAELAEALTDAAPPARPRTRRTLPRQEATEPCPSPSIPRP